MIDDYYRYLAPSSIKPTQAAKDFANKYRSEISVRTWNVLKWLGCESIKDIDDISDGEILRYPNIGRKTLREMRELAERHRGGETSTKIEPCCFNCQHFDPDYDEERGRCLKNPPVPIFIGGELKGCWPPVLSHQYCGEYKEDPYAAERNEPSIIG